MSNEIRVKVSEVAQGDHTFFVGAHRAKSLLEVAYVQHRSEGEGVQRVLSATRLKEIGAYLTSGNAPGLLPNSIILALKAGSTFDRSSSEVVIPRMANQAFVVDGQHRLFAFQPIYV